MKDRSLMILLIFKESKIAMSPVWGFSPGTRLIYFIVLEGKSIIQETSLESVF